MTRWPRLRESLSNVVRNAEADAGKVLVGVDMTAKTLTIRVEDNGVGIDPHVTPGGRNTAAWTRASGGHATVVRRSEPGDHLHLGSTPA
jgi:glucose-6-phosphate-specific signal transduction histidine kinase